MSETPENPKWTVLHVGCGKNQPHRLHEAFRNENWQEVRFDIDPLVEPDILGDMRDMKDVESESMNALWSSHNLEHLNSWEVPGALAEFKRVLKPGGLLMVTMPNIQKVAAEVAKGNLEDPLFVSAAGPIAAMDVIFGFQYAMKNGHHYMAHKTAFTVKTLGQKLEDAGFENIYIRQQGYNLWAYAYKNYDVRQFTMKFPNDDAVPYSTIKAEASVQAEPEPITPEPEIVAV